MGDDLRRSDKGWLRGAVTTVAANLVFLAAVAARAAAPADGAEPPRGTSAAACPGGPSPVAPTKAVPAPAPLASGESGWTMGFFGWAELDAIYDTTQSFTDSVLNNLVQRPHTIAGDNPRFQGTVKDSRLGFKVTAPPFEGMKASAFFEADFFGLQPPTATQDQSYTYAASACGSTTPSSRRPCWTPRGPDVRSVRLGQLRLLPQHARVPGRHGRGLPPQRSAPPDEVDHRPHRRRRRRGGEACDATRPCHRRRPAVHDQRLAGRSAQGPRYPSSRLRRWVSRASGGGWP
jgi:hypothetical protein